MSFDEIDMTGQWDPVRDPWERDYAALVPRFSGGLSAICSLLIICVILTSSAGLSKTYHRILMGMSISDVIGSIAIALTSLPMPTKMPFEEEFSYSWAGTRLGNTQTCNVQGFSFQLGFTSALSYNAMLCIYYACAIAFQMNERIIHKRVEPILHFIAIATSLVFALLPLFYELYNPSNSTYAWCGMVPYPSQCDSWPGVTCIRGNAEVSIRFTFVYMVFTGLIFFAIMFSLALVILRVYRNEKDLKKIIDERCRGFDQNGIRRVSRGVDANGIGIGIGRRFCTNPSPSDISRIQQSHKNTKIIVCQALAYFAVVVLEFCLPFVRGSGWVNADDHEESSRNTLIRLDKAILVILPMQGVFNCLIFISHKVYNYRRVKPHATICGALRATLVLPKGEEPYLMSRISIVKRDLEESNSSIKEDAFERFEICVTNEGNHNIRTSHQCFDKSSLEGNPSQSNNCDDVDEEGNHKEKNKQDQDQSSLGGHLSKSCDRERNQDQDQCSPSNSFLQLSSNEDVSCSEGLSSLGGHLSKSCDRERNQDQDQCSHGNSFLPLSSNGDVSCSEGLSSNDGLSSLTFSAGVVSGDQSLVSWTHNRKSMQRTSTLLGPSSNDGLSFAS